MKEAFYYAKRQRGERLTSVWHGLNRVVGASTSATESATAATAVLTHGTATTIEAAATPIHAVVMVAIHKAVGATSIPSRGI